MSIRNRLKELRKDSIVIDNRVLLPNGMLSISDWVFDVWLFRYGVEQERRKELMSEAVEDREMILDYYERMQQ